MFCAVLTYMIDILYDSISCWYIIFTSRASSKPSYWLHGSYIIFAVDIAYDCGYFVSFHWKLIVKLVWTCCWDTKGFIH